MKRKMENEQNNSAASVGGNPTEFNFDQWVKQVRPQLLASLHKRGIRY